MKTANSKISEDALAAIKSEEACLAAVLDSLNGQLGHASNKLKSESKRARELTSEIVSAVQEEDKALLASDEAVAHAMSHKKAADIEVLQKMIAKPYFARFVVEEEVNGKVKDFEYKLGFSANSDSRIIDWRKAPISKLYYDYREGDEFCEEIQGRERFGTIKLRNSVEIEDGQLKKLTCRYGTFYKDENGVWSGSESKTHRTGQARGTLPDVLSLITKDQFQTITEDAETAILIQGIAGSGKTTVALHRLAWLLHEDNSTLKAEHCAVIVLSKILKAYVENFLPSIGVPGVKVMTFHEWTDKTIKKICKDILNPNGEIKRPMSAAPSSVGRLLRSMALLTTLEEWEDARNNANLKYIVESTDWNNMPQGLVKILKEGKASNRSAAEIIFRLTNGIAHGLKSITHQHPLYTVINNLYRKLLAIETPSLYESLVAVLSYPDVIIKHDETKLITKDIIASTKDYIEQLSVKGQLDYALDALFIRLHRLRGGLLTLPDGTNGLYDHLVVDEAQDFSPMDLAIFIESVKDKRQLTLVGDTSQNIYEGADFPGWDKLIKHWNFKETLSRYVSLTVSHRSTLPIMRLAEHVQGRKMVTEGRAGRVPIWFRCYSEEKGFSEAAEWLTKALQHYPTLLTAVITPTIQDAKVVVSLLSPTFGQLVRLGDDNSFTFEEGIIVTDVLHSKGLEFTNVLIWNPTVQSYKADQHGRNMLYTAMTRAEENLCLVTWGRPTVLLPGEGSKLIRLVDVEDDPIEEDEPLPDYSKYEYNE